MLSKFYVMVNTSVIFIAEFKKKTIKELLSAFHKQRLNVVRNAIKCPGCVLVHIVIVSVHHLFSFLIS